MHLHRDLLVCCRKFSSGLTNYTRLHRREPIKNIKNQLTEPVGFLYFQEESIMSKKIDSCQEFINLAIYDGQNQKPTEGELQNEYNS